MAKYSPELIDQTISIFEIRTESDFTCEDARQAVENINGFFRVLQEWGEAEADEGSGVGNLAILGEERK